MNRGSSAPPPWGHTVWGSEYTAWEQKPPPWPFRASHSDSCFTPTAVNRSPRGIFSKNKPPFNPYLNVAIGGSLALQMLTIVVPGFRQLLGVTPLNLFDVAVIGGSSVLPLVINESRKEKKRKVGNER
jgi:hypothetical protein